MKILDPAFLSEIESENYRPASLLDMDLPGYYFRVTDWDTRIGFEGNLYYPRGMRLGNVSYGDTNIVSTLSIRIDDVDRALYESLGEVGVGRYPIKLRMAVLSEDLQVMGSLVVFTGNMSQWDYSPGSLRMTVASIFEQWGRVTTSKFSGSCRWKVFKGSECQYVGSEAQCDRTYTTCEEYGNAVNFGGFKWLPSMVNKRIEF